MIRLVITPTLIALACAAEPADMLRFTNGDQLHGTFLALKEGPQAVWQRDDVAAPVAFKTAQLRHCVLHGGHPLKPLTSLSHLGLANGDRIPGTVTAMDATTLTVDTSYAGVLHIPRKQVALLAPNPLGGRVCYYGPFAESDWKMKHTAYPDGLPDPEDSTKEKDKAEKDKTEKGKVDQAKAEKDKAEKDKAEKDKADAAKDNDGEDEDGQPANGKGNEKPPGRWQFFGSAWYWKNPHGGTALVRETGMPDRSILRFNLAWKNRLCLAIGFHADFAPPKRREADAKHGGIRQRGFVPGDWGDLPRLFGNSYVLMLYSNYMMLYRTAINDEGQPSMDQIQLNNNNLRLMESGDAKVEIRSNRSSGSIALFVNDEFVAQWSEHEIGGNKGAGFAGKGSGFGFVVQGDDAATRISDICVSEWNGMPDSARSMQVDDQDVVLMANGTDRYAGHVGELDSQGQVVFEGKHGRFQFPLNEVAEIRFAREQVASAPADAADNVCVRFSPVGSISGHPLPSRDAHTFTLLNPAAGEVNIALDAAVMLDFNATKQLIDDWNAEF